MTRRRTGWIAGLAAVVLAATGLAIGIPSASAATLQTNTWYVLVGSHSGLVLGIEGASANDGAGLVQQTRTNANHQQFRFVDAGGGRYRIQTRHSGKALDVYEWNAGNGARIVQWTDLGGTNQQWTPTAHADGTYSFVNRFSGKALDVWERSTAPGARISQYDVTGAANQRWELVPAAGGTDPSTPPGGGGDQTCANPPTAPSSIGGNRGAHDPALFAGCAGEPWYVFATGDGRVSNGTIPIRRSTNGGQTWSNAGTVWNQKPAWVVQAIPGVDNLWAPAIYHDAAQGKYYLYYSASTFGSQRSLIALATNTTLDPGHPNYRWVDEGLVLESRPGDPYNAIDGDIVVDDNGRRWMVFGSWWQGIHIVQLDWPSGKPAAGATPIRLATKSGGIEGPAMMKRGNYYYLFTSIGSCCSATATYQITVGRSTSVTGPFLDRNGVDMRNGGGTVVLGAHHNYRAAGGQSVHRGLIAYHSYYPNTFGFDLGIEQIRWTGDGWPTLSGI
jgi:arabinan endo-1,5-alpha-L-arabinosidase